LAYAECLESDKKLQEVHQLFNSFLATLARGFEDFEGKVAQNEELNEFLAALARDVGNIKGEANSNEESDEAAKSRRDQLYDQKQSYGMIYIAYLKFTLRSEGLNSFRSTFKIARKDKWIPWEVYEVAGIRLSTSLFIQIY
jgi:cleavage stimulation factor subunit 3